MCDLVCKGMEIIGAVGYVVHVCDFSLNKIGPAHVAIETIGVSSNLLSWALPTGCRKMQKLIVIVLLIVLLCALTTCMCVLF